VVEYFYDVIKAISGEEIKINSYITDDEEKLITSNCYLTLYDPKSEMIMGKVEGTYLDNFCIWEFAVPAEMTDGLKGKFWYSIQHESSNLCFRQPIYLV
jgi:hypothetical protein